MIIPMNDHCRHIVERLRLYLHDDVRHEIVYVNEDLSLDTKICLDEQVIVEDHPDFAWVWEDEE